MLEQAAQLEETGAGIQLSPNATRILIALGLGERLRAVRRRAAGDRRHEPRAAHDMARIPLGDARSTATARPTGSIHRGDLQAALLEAVRANPDIVLRLGIRVEDFVEHANGRQRRLPPRLAPPPTSTASR